MVKSYETQSTRSIYVTAEELGAGAKAIFYKTTSHDAVWERQSSDVAQKGYIDAFAAALRAIGLRTEA